ncbi:hypothetical protein [Thiothrix lacustris]|uniref:hypothetical protein n=1 Tax=Thiothrix lacustris TaxID=525917 RepID=UPI000491AF3A|nr:hypothetical protein [Thiothrix lacustris]
MNPLLTPEEQAHVASVRALQHSPDDLDRNPTKAGLGDFARWLARIDYHKAFTRAVQFLVLLSIGYATYKLVLIWQQYPGMAFLPFLDMHYPLMLFSGLFTANYIQHRDSEGVAIIALLSTMLNSLLV